MLLVDDFVVTRAICKTAAITEADKLSSNLVPIFLRNNLILELIQNQITKEVQETSKTYWIISTKCQNPFRALNVVLIVTDISFSEDVNTLFRGNTIGSKMITAYMRMIGMEYLNLVIKPLILKIAEPAPASTTAAQEGPRRHRRGSSLEVFLAIINEYLFKECSVMYVTCCADWPIKTEKPWGFDYQYRGRSLFQWIVEIPVWLWNELSGLFKDTNFLQNLRRFCGIVVDTVCGSLDLLPLEVRKIANLIWTAVTLRFSGE